MAPKLKCALVGYGRNAWIYFLIKTLSPYVRARLEIVGGWDPSQPAQAKFDHKHIPVSQNLDDLLEIPGLDAVIINSPPQFHADQVVAALEAGKHAYSEVPMALTEGDIGRIIAAEERSGKCYQLGENYIYFAEVLYASHLIETGRIGPGVYAEAEYLHDITYRWRENGVGGPDAPKVKSWYSLFDPLMYAHSIGPAQVALGGLHSPAEFTEVVSYANDLGGYNGVPICSPSKAFHVALFRTEENAIAKCAGAYKFAREPTRMGVQIVGRTGTFEAPQYGRGGRLFLADGDIITPRYHRKGKIRHIGRLRIASVANQGAHPFLAATRRSLSDWIRAIETGKRPALNAKVAANMTLSGIAASESARAGKPVSIKRFRV